MTETSGDNALRFEIWFRRRTSKNQAYILQAGNADIKHAWTSDIARILWQQATRNKGERGFSRVFAFVLLNTLEQANVNKREISTDVF